MSTITQDTIPAQISTFRLDEEWYSVDVLKVQEVLEPLPINTVPLTDKYIIGLINVRGIIVTCLSIKERLGFDDCDYGENYHNVIINDPDDGHVCLLVDEIGDVIQTNDLVFADRPPTIPAKAKPFIAGVFRDKDKLITFLDADAIIRAS